jgi:hypothetical protein
VGATLSAHEFHAQMGDFHADMAAARESDHLELNAKLEQLAKKDESILQALQNGDDRLRRVEEFLIAFSKVSSQAPSPLV